MQDERLEAQARLSEVGWAGQDRLAAARVLIVGVGGLGCASATYLALGGVGTLRLVDGDRVAASNLGRQALYREDDVGSLKVEVAAERLRDRGATIETRADFVDRSNFAELLEGVDLVVDGTDSLGARRLLNRALVTLRIPVVFGAASGFRGTVLALAPGGPCYDCVWTEPAAEGCEAGVFGPLVGMVGAAQAGEAMRLLLGLGEGGRLLTVDALRPEWRTVRVRRREGCPTCGTSLREENPS